MSLRRSSNWAPLYGTKLSIGVLGSPLEADKPQTIYPVGLPPKAGCLPRDAYEVKAVNPENWTVLQALRESFKKGVDHVREVYPIPIRVQGGMLRKTPTSRLDHDIVFSAVNRTLWFHALETNIAKLRSFLDTHAEKYQERLLFVDERWLFNIKGIAKTGFGEIFLKSKPKHHRHFA